MKNNGVILGDHINTYRSGRLGAVLPYEVRNESGDWEADLPLEERQSNDNGDSMSCVTFGEVSGIETQEFSWLKAFGIPDAPNYSDRWIAKMSGTTREGNYLWKVAETIRKYGLVREESYPAPPLPWTWEQYHADINPALKAKLELEGQEWLKKWDVKYESIAFDKASLIYHLKMSPLVVVLPGHVVLNFKTTAQVIHYFDTYVPFKKTTPEVVQAMKVVLYKKEQAVPDEALLVDLKLGDTGRQVEKLLNALDKLGWKLSIKRSNIYLYDLEVADLVSRFKLANTCPKFWARMWERYVYKGRDVVQWEREIINNLIKNK